MTVQTELPWYDPPPVRTVKCPKCFAHIDTPCIDMRYSGTGSDGILRIYYRWPIDKEHKERTEAYRTQLETQ